MKFITFEVFALLILLGGIILLFIVAPPGLHNLMLIGLMILILVYLREIIKSNPDLLNNVKEE